MTVVRAGLIGRFGPLLLGAVITLLYGGAWESRADVRIPSIFSDHAVVQRDQPLRIWGRADAGEKVTVSFASRQATTRADAQGRWRVEFKPLGAGGPYDLVVEGRNRVRVADVMVGEVWVCSGQSNMEWPLDRSYGGDLERAANDRPLVRLLTVPHVGVQTPRDDFQGDWQVATGVSAAKFSAVGYYFGLRLAETLDVPIGLIDNAWGGSACEAWVRRDLLEADPKYGPLIDHWTKIERDYDHEAELARWRESVKRWTDGGEQGGRPRQPVNPLTWKDRPANLYNGVLHPLFGYGIRGVIWYQGESNVGRARQYRDLFPLMIENWRNDWGIGAFPFYWAQLADFHAEAAGPGQSTWAELREAQSMTLDRLPAVGEAVIIDLGESNNIHPRKKQEVGDRLARLALANDYGIDVACRSPRFQSLTTEGGKAVVRFDVGDRPDGALEAFDTGRPVGFAVAGDDREWFAAEAQVLDRERVAVWSRNVPKPVAVRYAWADNPEANLYSKAGLPACPFRTDSWPGLTDNRLAP